jgi:spermidine/putrescine transport system substrate-binding protein
MKKPLLAVALLLSSTSLAAAEGQLNLFNWGDYTSPQLLEKFEKETGIHVTVTDYDSNDTALAKVSAGGAGFDLVVPSAHFVQIYVEKGLIQKLDLTRLPHHGNIAPEWMDVPWDKGREYTIPWQWGSTGISVDTSVYKGDPNTSELFLNPPDELKGKINVVPEMNEVVGLAVMWAGGEPCTEDVEVLKKARDALLNGKQYWASMDYGTTEHMANGDWSASVNWSGESFRSRLKNPNVVYGYPKEGYPVWMDSVALLSDAKNVDEAYKFLDFIMLPENAALISEFARYPNGITGSIPFMPADMQTAPEVIIPAEFASKGHFMPTCSGKALDYMTAIWTELQK